MRGLQLKNAREARRREWRKEAIGAGTMRGAFLALDEEEMTELVSTGATSSRGNAVKLHFIVKGLKAHGWPIDRIAAALSYTVHDLERIMAVPLLDPDRTGEKIDAAILEELPETPEPGRYVEAQI